VFIVREAVTNALRHGRAESIRVQLSKENDSTVLRVIDNGVGFDANQAFEAGHFGMVTMKEKATSVGASLVVHSLPSVGTTVEILWP
jgi:NarL family two-component system sensor histidine kinase LiaS